MPRTARIGREAKASDVVAISRHYSRNRDKRMANSNDADDADDAARTVCPHQLAASRLAFRGSEIEKTTDLR